MVKAKVKGYKEGIMSKDLIGFGFTHRKGSTVRYRKYKKRNERNNWTGDYEYHYLDLNNYNLIRCKYLLINT